MTSLAEYKYDEVSYAAKIAFEKKFLSKHKPTELRLLALHYRDVDKLAPEDRRDRLYKFCEKNIKDYVKADWSKCVNQALKHSLDVNNKLIYIESIPITIDEIEYISGLNVSHNYRKFLFTFLVQARLNELVAKQKNDERYNPTFFKGGLKKYKQIQKMAHVPKDVDINLNFVHDMYRSGLIELFRSGLIRHTWLDSCIPQGAIMIDVKHFEDVGLYWDYYCKIDRVRLCRHCNEPFYVTPRNKMYCDRCKDYKSYHPRLVTRKITCVDCGKEVFLNPKANHKKRCDDCQLAHRRNRKSSAKSN